jgi:O-antigen ligase
MRTSMTRVPAPIWLLVASFLCPTELSLYLFGLRLPPHRVALLILFPIALAHIVRRGTLTPRSFDALFLAYNVWTVGVLMAHQGAGEGLQFGGSLALESFAAYLVARVYVRDIATFVGTLGVLVTAVAIAGLIALPEMLSGVHYVHDVLRMVTSYEHPIGHETRLGLTRAYGTFDHPIHLGTFCASVLAMVWFAAKKRRELWRRVPILIGATLTGLSSAPLLCLALQGGLIVWERVTRGVKARVAITIALLVVLYGAAEVASTRSPLTIIATGFTLDSWTGYYRTLIWQHGLENVWGSPWIGIGLADWERPQWMAAATVDAFWLVVAMRSGIPAFLLLAAAILLLVRAVVVRMRRMDIEMRRMARGWIISLIALVLVACTVHLWNVVHAHLFFFIGLAGWLADANRTRQAKPAQTAMPPRVQWQATPDGWPRPVC